MNVVYNEEGKIFVEFAGTGNFSILSIEVPENNYIDYVDISNHPHKPVFKEYAKTELELIKEANEKQQADIDYLMLLNENLI